MWLATTTHWLNSTWETVKHRIKQVYTIIYNSIPRQLVLVTRDFARPPPGDH